MALRVEGHPVISLAAADRGPADDGVGLGIDDCEHALILKIDVHLPRDGVVLRHARLTVEGQRLDDRVRPHVSRQCSGRVVARRSGAPVSNGFAAGFTGNSGPDDILCGDPWRS